MRAAVTASLAVLLMATVAAAAPSSTYGLVNDENHEAMALCRLAIATANLIAFDGRTVTPHALHATSPAIPLHPTATGRSWVVVADSTIASTGANEFGVVVQSPDGVTFDEVAIDYPGSARIDLSSGTWSGPHGTHGSWSYRAGKFTMRGVL